ncbi:MAG: hypothetical protein ACYCUW_01835 [bacterium]
MKKKSLMILITGVLMFVGIVYSVVYLMLIRPNAIRLALKQSVTELQTNNKEIAGLKKKNAILEKEFHDMTVIKQSQGINGSTASGGNKVNIKESKKDYLLFKKYQYGSPYFYNHNKIVALYLKRSAYAGYPKAEYEYAIRLNPRKAIYNYCGAVSYNRFGTPRKNYNCAYISYLRSDLYVKAVVFIKLAAKQKYAPAMFQIAMLNLKGGLTIAHYSNSRPLGVSGYDYYYDKINLFPCNPAKAKKMLYALAEKGYRPAKDMVNKLYNQQG